ncbi:DUF3857 domain-containing transglutaminase family protein [Mucilaginibacter sp. BT774]|nr:DUF3857 domain-containing transglutaminase family protein [Mucilaginibacter sp. BT774]
MCLNNYLKAGVFLLGGFLLSASKVYSQDKDIPQEFYKASGIPDSLKEDANSVIRYSSDEVKIKGPGKAVIKHHSLVTILNEKGDKDAVIVFSYNKKFDTYSNIDVHVYDESGKMIKKYHKSDMYDGAASSDETLVSDDRFLGLKHTVSRYPETIEVSYEEDLNSYIDLPSWYIQEKREQSAQEEHYKIWCEPAAGLRYKSKNISLTPVKTSDGSYDVYSWNVRNLKALKKEEESESWTVLPNVVFATSLFNCYGYAGDFSTWQNFGKWIQGLNNDMCILSAPRIAEIKKMTDTIKTEKEKVKFLYKYMQQNMRYVGIQLGIGGYKPFPASFVDEKKYGDCKALSNYMQALLKAVDIPSYYALIRAGANEESADLDFPFNNFTHAILCVPLKKDTVWLECTSRTQLFGELGSFTENRNALLITEDGGKLVNTPRSTPQENQFNSEVRIELQPDGGAKAHVKVLSTGGYRDMFIGFTAEKLDEQKEFLLRYFKMKQPSSFDFKTSPDKAEINELSMDLEYDKFCDVLAGDKQFYRPRVFDLWALTVPILEKRRTDFYFDHPMEKSCVTTIDIPAGFEVEALPVNAALKFTYGNYELNYAYNKEKNQVVSTAKFVLNNQVIPAGKYTEMQQYMDAVAKAQNKKLVIKKKA